MEAQLHADLGAGQLRVRPLCQNDARGVAGLIAALTRELGTKQGMTLEQTEQLFATPWLDGGMGLILEHGSEVAGYGFARPSRWKGKDTIQIGLSLKKGYRDRESHGILTDPLLEAATELARKHKVDNITIHLRGTDTVHPPVVLELGFQEHPVSMLGFRHDLEGIPPRPVPQGLALRPARLPEESRTLLDLMERAFDDRDRQGEPIADSYLVYLVGRSGFDPEQVLLLEDSGGPVGGVIIDIAARGPGVSSGILQVGVLPGLRGRGIGSAMICRSLEWLKARGARETWAGMFSSNRAATLFWRLGFRPDPTQTFRFFLRDAAAQQEHYRTAVAGAKV
jgi:GNAT superfamily N-acetyltransferase